MNILITECMILPMSDRVNHDEKRYFRGSIGISNGKIAFASADAEEKESFLKQYGTNLRQIDGRGKLVMPGFVNIHGHVSMTLMRGYADDIPLMEWLHSYVWPFEAKMTSDDIRLGAELGIVEMLLGGTTTFVDMYWQEREVAKAVDRCGIRAVLAPTFTDDKFDDFELDLAKLVEEYGNHPRIGIMVAPHSVYSCSRENLLKAKKLAENYGVAIKTHVSETLDEQRIMREKKGKTPIEYLDELGMLSDSTLVVHAVHVNDSDIEIMAKRGVSVAYNPHSNMKIASGIAPITKMLEAGINVGIGCDGASSNNDLDMLDELRTGSFLQKVATMDPVVIPAYQALEMATVNGAKAIGMGERLGRVERGMIADLQVINLESAHLYPQHDIVANLVYCGKSSDVEMVIVGGEIVVEGAKVSRVDEMEICHQVQRRIEELIKK